MHLYNHQTKVLLLSALQIAMQTLLQCQTILNVFLYKSQYFSIQNVLLAKSRICLKHFGRKHLSKTMKTMNINVSLYGELPYMVFIARVPEADVCLCVHNSKYNALERFLCRLQNKIPGWN